MPSLSKLIKEPGEEGIYFRVVDNGTGTDGVTKELTFHHAHQAPVLVDAMARCKPHELVGACGAVIFGSAVERFLRQYAVVVTNQLLALPFHAQREGELAAAGIPGF